MSNAYIFGSLLFVSLGLEGLLEVYSSRDQARQALYYSQGSTSPIITMEDINKVEEEISGLSCSRSLVVNASFGIAGLLGISAYRNFRKKEETEE